MRIKPQEKVGTKTLSVSLPEPLLELLDKYSSFYESKRAYVVQEVLYNFLRSDAKFQEWLRGTQSVVAIKKGKKENAA